MTFTVATLNVQDEEELVRVTEHNEVTLTEDEIGNYFQDTSSKEEFGTE